MRGGQLLAAFAFHDEFFLHFDIPECISISRYDSISGEQLNPYRRLSAGTIQTLVGGGAQYKALIHRRIPVHAVGIEIFPAYYEDYLKRQFPEEYFDLSAAFTSVDQSEDFPAMSRLLIEIEAYRGEGMAAGLFYEAKVAEAISLVANEQKKQSGRAERPLSSGDLAGLENVVSYIGDHYAFDIPLERLAGIACMSATKLKKLLQALAGLHHHGIHPGAPHEPGRAPADRYRFHHGPDRPDDRLFHLQPLCGAVQKKHRHPAHRVSTAGKAWIRDWIIAGAAAQAVQFGVIFSCPKEAIRCKQSRIGLE